MISSGEFLYLERLVAQETSHLESMVDLGLFKVKVIEISLDITLNMGNLYEQITFI